MKKPILLIYPPFEGKGYLKSRAPFPIGPLYIAAYLESKKISAKVVDMSYPPNKSKTTRPKQLKTGQPNYFRFGWTNKEIIDWLEKNLNKYSTTIGVSSLMSSNWTGAYEIVNLIKNIERRKRVVMGGPHATAFPEHVFKYTKTDYICMGEGEKIFYQFLMGNKEQSGMVSRFRRNYLSSYADKSFINNLDALPFPRRNLLEDDRQINEIYVTFSRGCPHKCSFCGSHLIQGRKWRHKSIDYILKEIEFYIKHWGIKHFVIEDDNPCPGKKGEKHLQELCKRIIKKNIKVKFSVSHGIPVYTTARKENCKLLWNAGFRKMVFPLESTDKAVLHHMNKEFTPNNWRKAIKSWKYEKNHPTEIIIGYPFVDTIETMLRTMLEIAERKCLIWASHFRLNKGTKLFQQCIDAGYISKNYDPINTQSLYIETERFKIQDLKELMQISRGLNFIIESGSRLFIDDPFTDFEKNPRNGKIIAKDIFKFRRSQNIAASIILTKEMDIVGRPFVSYDKSGRLIYKGNKKSRVYDILRYILTGKKGRKLKDILK